MGKISAILERLLTIRSIFVIRLKGLFTGLTSGRTVICSHIYLSSDCADSTKEVSFIETNQTAKESYGTAGTL